MSRALQKLASRQMRDRIADMLRREGDKRSDSRSGKGELLHAIARDVSEIDPRAAVVPTSNEVEEA